MIPGAPPPFDYAILTPYFAFMLVLAFYGIYRYQPIEYIHRTLFLNECFAVI